MDFNIIYDHINLDEFKYDLINFKDRIVQYPNRFEYEVLKWNEDKGVYEQTGEYQMGLVQQKPGEIFQGGTPLNADVMGKIDVALYILSQKYKELDDIDFEQIINDIDIIINQANEDINEKIEEFQKWLEHQGIYFDQGKWWRAEFKTIDGDPVITRTEIIDYEPPQGVDK